MIVGKTISVECINGIIVIFLFLFCQVTLDGAICVEEFSKCRALGRAFLRSSGSTIAVGIVNKIMGQGQY